MKKGKIPEIALKRSVFKQIRHRREEVIVRPGVGMDGCGISLNDEDMFVLSTDPVSGTVEEVGTKAIHKTCNNIVCHGGDMIGVMVSILLPNKSGEQQVKRLMHDIEAECEQLNIEVLGGHTEYTSAVNMPVITVTGIGRVKKAEMFSAKNIRPDQQIVMTRWAGLEGTARIADAMEENLKTRYTSSFIQGAKQLNSYKSIVQEALIARTQKVTAMHDVTEGGIFAGLWEIADAAGLGLQVDLSNIPLKQETIEVCEFYDLNPYMLLSSGCLLLVTDDAVALVETLHENGIPASIIGRMVEGHERIVVNEDETRYLQPHRMDEVYKVIQ